MAFIDIGPEILDIRIASGNKVPLTITVKDYDGNEITSYTPYMAILQNGNVRRELGLTSGLLKSGAKTSLLLPSDLRTLSYRWFFEVTLLNWKFTIYTGEYLLRNPWEPGGSTNVFDYVYRLPVKVDDTAGGFYLVDDQGAPILDSEGQKIDLGNPNNG